MGTMIGCMILAIMLAACTGNGPTGEQAAVTMEAELTARSVHGTEGGATASASGGIDSLAITRVRILISRLTLREHRDDSTAADREMKSGPILLAIDGPGGRTFTTGTVAPGTCDRIDFEFHRFGSGEMATFLDDTAFGAFVTRERNSLIVDGHIYSHGLVSDFTYRSGAVRNVSLDLDPPVSISAGSLTTIVLRLDPTVAFLENGRLLDPRDPHGSGRIDLGLARALRASWK